MATRTAKPRSAEKHERAPKRARGSANGAAPVYQLARGANPYLEYHARSMATLPADVGRLFDPALDDERRDELDAAVCAVLTEDVIEQYAWAVPDERALRAIAHFGPILEIGGGSGYWAACLRDRGVDVLVADLHTGGGGRRAVRAWTEVVRAGPALCKQHASRSLLLVYPDDFERSAESVALRSARARARAPLRVAAAAAAARGAGARTFRTRAPSA